MKIYVSKYVRARPVAFLGSNALQHPEDKGLKGSGGSMKGPCWNALTSQNAAQIVKKPRKFNAKKTYVFECMFLLILHRFGLPKCIPNPTFFQPFLKTSIL